MAKQVREIDGALAAVNALLDGPYRLAWVDFAAARSAKRNARYMKPEMMDRLAANIARDGQLASLPLCWCNSEGRYETMSGHHRIQAAIDAGVDSGLVLYTDSELSQEERLAIQLSHNALSGSDDVQVLLEMVRDIQTPQILEYAAADLIELPDRNPVKLLAMTEAKLVLRPITFYLTDPEAQTFDEFVEAYNQAPMREDSLGYLVHKDVWDEFMEIMAEMAGRHGLKSANAALSEVVELIRVELASG